MYVVIDKPPTPFLPLFSFLLKCEDEHVSIWTGEIMTG